MDIGIIANPASGKDIRRLTARASVFDNQEKSAIVRRCIAGLEGLCSDVVIRYYPDSHHITRAALAQSNLRSHPIDAAFSSTAEDSTVAAHHLREANVVISLGGDGTNRAIGKSLGDVPLIALSTGTNNAFPVFCEATTAGMAAALIALEQVPVEQVAPRTKALHVTFEDGETDIALIDVVGTRDVFHGTRAILDPSKFVFAALSVADPSKVGMTAIGGMTRVVDNEHDFGLVLSFPGSDQVASMHEVDAPIAPGMVCKVRFTEIQKVRLGELRKFTGATMLAFDGERERVLTPDESVMVCVERDGPRRVNVKACMELVACSSEAIRRDEERVEKYAH